MELFALLIHDGSSSPANEEGKNTIETSDFNSLTVHKFPLLNLIDVA